MPITVIAYKMFFRMKCLTCTKALISICISVRMKEGKGNILRLAVEVNIITAGFTTQHTSLTFIHAFWTAAMVLQAIF